MYDCIKVAGIRAGGLISALRRTQDVRGPRSREVLDQAHTTGALQPGREPRAQADPVWTSSAVGLAGRVKISFFFFFF